MMKEKNMSSKATSKVLIGIACCLTILPHAWGEQGYLWCENPKAHAKGWAPQPTKEMHEKYPMITTTTMVIAPPKTTDGTVPISFAATPDSTAPH